MKKALGLIPIVDHKKMYEDTAALLKKVRMDFDPQQMLGELSVSQMQSVEIAKAVSANCKVLILDEPTSSLTQNEVEALFRIVEDLKRDGVAIVYISHKMDEILRISDEDHHHADGQYIGTWPAKEMTTSLFALPSSAALSAAASPLSTWPGSLSALVFPASMTLETVSDISREASFDSSPVSEFAGEVSDVSSPASVFSSAASPLFTS